MAHCTKLNNVFFLPFFSGINHEDSTMDNNILFFIYIY